jgi:hypothetical protein
MKRSYLLIGLTLLALSVKCQTSYTWNGTVSTAWNTPGNWSPNGVPGGADNVTIVTGSNTCILNASSPINNLTLTSGTLDLGSATLTVGGSTATFSSGTVQNGTLTITAATTTTFNGAVTINCPINITSSTVTLRNTTFQQTLAITKTGASNDASGGNNIFNGPATFTNAGSGYLMLGNGNPDQFNNSATFNNTGSANVWVAYNSTGNVFGGLTTFNNTPTGNNGIYVGWNSTGTSFSGNIVAESTNGQGVQFCGGNTTATATLGTGYTISIAPGGFSAGTLLLRQFTQTGGTAQNITLTGTGALTYGPSSSFAGNVTSSSPTLFLNGCTFNGTSTFTKTGATGDYGQGGNTFNGICSITNSGSSYLLLGNTNPDTWNSDVTFTDNGSERLLPCWASAGNLFNGNIYVNTAGSAQGIQFCGGNTTATATLAATKTIQAGSTGLTAGYLYLKQFAQAGNAPVNLTGTGSSVMYLGPSSSFGGTVTVTAPDIWAQGATYNSAAVFTKTGGSNNHNNQYQNIFNSTCTINQQSSSGYFMLGYNSNDLFNDNITLTCTAAGGIYLGWTSGTGTPTLAAGKTIQIGAAGFNAGFLQLNTFTQLGNAPMSLGLTGTNTSLTLARGSAIGGNLTTSSPDLYLNGCTFNGTTNLTKTGSGGDYGQGGNVFNGVSTIINSGASYLLLGNTNPDTWNSDVTFTDNGSDRLLPCWASTGNQFNGNIIVNTSGSAAGIQFCGGNTTATASLAATKTIQAGSTGLNAGYLILRQFTQAGNAPVNLTLANTASYLQFGPASSFGGDIVTTSPGLYFSGCTFGGILSSTKTGASNDNSSGSNIFKGVTTLTNAGSGYLLLGNGNSDQFNNTATFNNTGSANLYVAWNSTGNVFGGLTTFNNTPTANNLIYVSWNSAGTSFNNNVVVSSTNGQGVQFCGGNATATATLAAGNSISVGPGGFSAGTLLLWHFTQVGATPQTLNLTGTSILTYGAASSFDGAVTSSSPTLYLNGCTFNGTSSLTKTGITSDYSTGGNTFNGVCSITNSGSNFVVLGNNNPDTWNADVTFTDNGSDRLLPCWASAGNQFNGNIFVNTSGSASGIQFCGGNTTASATLAAGMTIAAGSTGLNNGYLILKQFTQLGNKPVNLSLGSSATYLQFGPSSAIGGDLNSSSPGLFFNGCTFSGAVTSIKTGSSNDNSSGTNIFNGVTTLTDAGSGQLLLGNGNSDQFNNTATFNNTGSSNIYVAYNSPSNVFGGVTTFNNTPTANTGIYVSWNSAGTTFSNNIIVGSNNGQGVQFCGGNATASATLSAGYTLSIGSAGFSSGTLLLRHFTQVGATPQSLPLTGTGILTYGPSSSFDGNLTSSSPTLFFNGCTFNGTSNCTKTGSTGDYSQGGNVFNGVSTIVNSGTSFLLLGNNNPDIWNNDVTFTDNGSERLLPCWNTTGNQFNGNIYVNTAGSAQGIQFCGGSTTATALLAAGKSIQSGSTGLNAGYLILKQFTQAGNAPISLTLGSSATYLQFGPSSSLGGDVVSSSPGLYFNGCTFNGAVTSTKNGATNDNSSGNNIFNGVTNITDAGSGYLLLGNGNSDQFNSTANFNNSGSSTVYVAYNSPNNVFGGVTTFSNTPTANTGIYVSSYSPGTTFTNNIIVNSTFGAGVQFCSGNGSATATLNAGNTISVGSLGFTAGTLLLRQFTQAGATSQNLTLTGTGILTFGPSSAFNGATTTSSPALFFNGCTFNNSLNSTKTGATNDQSNGNNFFNGANIFTNNGTGYLMMSSSLADAYNGDVTFVKAGSGAVYPNYNGNCTYSGNLTVTSPSASAITFGSGSGTATFTGSGGQNVSATAGTATPVFTRLVINNTGSGVTLSNTSVNVSSNLTLTSGLLNTSAAYILTMLNGSTTAAGTALSTSYVNGPMRYQKSSAGSTVLNFPIGAAPDCRPVVLTVNHSNGTLYTYTAQLYDANAYALGYTLPPSVQIVSSMHYYIIGRTDVSGTSQPTAGLSGNQTIQIFFGTNDYVTDGSTLTIVKNTYLTPTKWIDIGGTGAPPYSGGADLIGSITSTSSPTAFNSFSTFALANRIGGSNVLPMKLLYFNAKPDNSQVDLSWSTATESNNDYFTVEKSRDGVSFDDLTRVRSAAPNGTSSLPLYYSAVDPTPYTGTTWYRLRQTDLNGNSTYSNIVSVDFLKTNALSVYPNPSTGIVYVDGLGNNQSMVNVEWFDLGGRLLLQQTAAITGGTTRLTTHFNNGVYILKFTTADGTIVTKTILIMK